MKGYIYRPDGIWFYGNGDIEPYNWSKEFQQQIRPRTKPKPTQITMSLQAIISQSVKAVTGISVEAMQVRTRKGHIVDARRMHSAILREMTGMKIDDIAALMNKEGGNYCDHPNVMHYIKTDKNMVETDPNYRRNREAVVRRVKRLYKPDFNTVDAWGNLWGGISLPRLI